MAKKVVVTDKVKIRGIRRRWLINSVGVVLLVLALALGTFSTAMWSYYYSSTMNDLKRRAADDAGGFASFTRSQYWTNAQNAVQKFEDKTKLELQFLDDTGAVQYSSNDLAAGTTPGTQDIQSALNYQEAVAWKGTDPHTGERVVAASAPIVYHGQTVAVVRYVTSLVAIDWQFSWLWVWPACWGRPSWPWSTSPISTLSAPSWSLWPVLQRPPGSSLMEATGCRSRKNLTTRWESLPTPSTICP